MVKVNLFQMVKAVVNTRTLDEFKKLMRLYQAAGWVGSSGLKPTALSDVCWIALKEQTHVEANDRFKMGQRNCYKAGWMILSFAEFLWEQDLIEDDIPSEQDLIEAGILEFAVKK